jgi:hypothetical protein
MCLALNTAKIAKGGFLSATIGDTQYLIKKHHVEYQEKMMWSGVFPGHNTVKAVIE